MNVENQNNGRRNCPGQRTEGMDKKSARPRLQERNSLRRNRVNAERVLSRSTFATQPQLRIFVWRLNCHRQPRFHVYSHCRIRNGRSRPLQWRRFASSSIVCTKQFLAIDIFKIYDSILAKKRLGEFCGSIVMRNSYGLYECSASAGLP